MKKLLILLLAPAIVLAANLPPKISGTPSPSAVVGKPYSFTPTVIDDGPISSLKFVIQNRPKWLSFSYSSGRISGTPTLADVGLYSGIRIFVDDGPNAAVGTPKFSIAVIQPAGGSARIKWVAPTLKADGTPLTNLAGYRILYGTSPTALDKSIEIKSPIITGYAVDNLTPATWYFAVIAYNTDGAESVKSNIASTTG